MRTQHRYSSQFPPSMNRRTFLATAAAAAVTGTTQTLTGAEATSASPRSTPRVQLGISSYSFWHFTPQKVSIEQSIDRTAALGVAGLDILHRQMETDELGPLNAELHAFCRKLKRHALRAGVALNCLSTHQSFHSPNPAELHKWMVHTEKCIEIAYALVIPCLRVNTGPWGTVPYFNELMKRRGEEPPPKGVTEDDGFKWCIDSLEKCVSIAEDRGIVLALENHWGLSRTPEGMIRILDALPHKASASARSWAAGDGSITRRSRNSAPVTPATSALAAR